MALVVKRVPWTAPAELVVLAILCIMEGSAAEHRRLTRKIGSIHFSERPQRGETLREIDGGRVERAISDWRIIRAALSSQISADCEVEAKIGA